MNINKTTLCAIFIALFSAVSVNGAVTAFSTGPAGFNGALGSAVWDSHVRYTLAVDQLEVSNNTTTFSTSHSVWSNPGYDSFSLNTVTMGFAIAYDGINQLTVTLNDVTSTQVGFGPYVETSIQTVTVGSFTTLWFGLASSAADNALEFNLINASIGGVAIPSLSAVGNNFAGEYFAINEAQPFSIIGQLQLVNSGSPHDYNSDSGADFRVFGDNTLASIPEPNFIALVGITGILILLRRHKS